MIKIMFHWPHHRFAFGWEQIFADEEFDYNTFTLYFFVLTITIDYK